MSPLISGNQIARGLGWFSIALGFLEIAAPARVRRATGAPASPGLIAVYGLREILTGVAILAARQPARWVWLRVAGDLLDLATLAPGLDGRNPRRAMAAASMASVLAVTLVDLACAMKAGEAARSRRRKGWR